MRTCLLRPDLNRWLLTDEDGTLVTAYSTKGDALRGAARRVSMVFGRLLILRADGTVEEDRRYPARKILPTDRDAGHAGCSKPRQ